MKTRKKADKVYYSNFHLAGFVYWDAPQVFEELKIGSVVELERETDNKFDPYAIAIYYQDYKIGYVPKDKNLELGKFLETGHGDIFVALINNINQNAHAEQKIGITVYLKDFTVKE